MSGMPHADLAGPQGGRHSRRRSAWTRALRSVFLTLVAGGMAVAAGFSLFADYVSSLSTPGDPGAADAIIVVTGGRSRLEAAIALLRQGKGERLLISGVHPAADLDDIREATGGDKRLFACCIDVDHAALDTVGNAEESAKWLKDHAYDSAILVTNNYHMPRTLLEMRRMQADTEFVPYPVVNTPIDGGAWLKDSEVLRVLFTEYAKYLAALVRSALPTAGPAGDIEMAKASAGSG